jgi:transaldolase/glucose-6-phosphate isomerase
MSTVTETNPRLLALIEAGVSVWLDQIRRSLVESGELARMIAEDGLRGMTANPSIFEKPILGSTDYDEKLERLAQASCAREGRPQGASCSSLTTPSATSRSPVWATRSGR